MKLPVPQKKYEFRWRADWQDRRLKEILAEVLPKVSSRALVLIVANGLVKADRKKLDDLDAPIPSGADLTVDLTHGARGQGRSKNRPLLDQMKVVHDDEHVVVVDKAEGILVQPVEGTRGTPLVELLKHYWQSKGERPVNPIVVQRLDKETSGLMVMGKTADAGRNLQRQAAGRFMERRYVALVEGRIREDRGTWHNLIGVGEGKLRQVVGPVPEPEETGAKPKPKPAKQGPGGQEAITHYKVLERLPGATLLELRLETGRTHQIRIHCAEAGHPVIGDPVYVKLARMRHDSQRFGRQVPPSKRMMLHAIRLKFQHPIKTSRWITKTSEMPSAFAKYMDLLKNPPPEKVRRKKR
ncbi:RNA pseudouridine synthase [bacterium]|nr:RNA pseudouridine synthase [bacterium]